MGGDNSTTSFSGVISNPGGITKLGTGIMTLTGVNTYSGVTTASAGTLQLTGSGSMASTSNLTLNANSVFKIDNSGISGTYTARLSSSTTMTFNGGRFNMLTT